MKRGRTPAEQSMNVQSYVRVLTPPYSSVTACIAPPSCTRNKVRLAPSRATHVAGKHSRHLMRSGGMHLL